MKSKRIGVLGLSVPFVFILPLLSGVRIELVREEFYSEVNFGCSIGFPYLAKGCMVSNLA
jgi:hypothetical protein